MDILKDQHRFDFDFSQLEEQGIFRIGELVAYITMGCDLRCLYCYVRKRLTETTDQSELMSLEFLFSLVAYLIASGGGKMDRLTLLGGEPTLHPFITEIINELANYSIGEKRMTTNGRGLHKLRLEELEPNVLDHISVSVDGVNPLVNAKTRGNNTFEQSIDTIKKYIEAGIKVSVTCTVTGYNIDALIPTLEYFYDLGVSIINFHKVSPTSYTYQNTNLLVSPLDWVQSRDKLFEYIEQNGHRFPGLTVRVPWTYLTPKQIVELDYEPMQVKNPHSPEGGHRLLVTPPTEKNKGSVHISSDLMDVENTQIGNFVLDPNDPNKYILQWNTHENNELTAYKEKGNPANIANAVTGWRNDEITGKFDLIEVSHSFKWVYTFGNPLKVAHEEHD
jgi:pyruvate-formate lyase-activating enzyme